MSDNLKVTAAAFIGAGVPAGNWFVDSASSVLHILLIAGQLGVAVVTILYILQKWKNAKKKNPPPDA